MIKDNGVQIQEQQKTKYDQFKRNETWNYWLTVLFLSFRLLQTNRLVKLILTFEKQIDNFLILKSF